MKKIIVMLFLFLSAAACFGAGKYAPVLEDAEKSFAAGDYGKAVEIYESLVQVEKVRNPYVYYNLSNAYYRNGQLGKAVLNIEKAFLLGPRDKDTRHNRAFLHGRAGIAESDGFENGADKLAGICSLNEATVFFSAIVILLLSAFALSLSGIRKLSKKPFIILTAFFVLSGLMLALKIYREIVMVRVVSLTNVAVRSGPGENNPEIFNLPEGRIAVIENLAGGWSCVKVSLEGLSGWVKDAETGKINE